MRADLARDQLGGAFALFIDQARELAQHHDALVRSQPAVAVGERARGALELVLERSRVIGRNLAELHAVERLVDGKHCAPAVRKCLAA
jgi:hypothetical protein